MQRGYRHDGDADQWTHNKDKRDIDCLRLNLNSWAGTCQFVAVWYNRSVLKKVNLLKSRDAKLPVYGISYDSGAARDKQRYPRTRAYLISGGFRPIQNPNQTGSIYGEVSRNTLLRSFCRVGYMLQSSFNRYVPIAICIVSITLGGCLDSAENAMAVVPNGTPPPPSNSVPTISGVPTTSVAVGDAWAFTPSASDADGDPLIFSIENQPVWATFDTDNGLLSGRPQLGHAGTYSNIIVAVSDGQAMSGLPAFTLTVENVIPGNNRPPQLSGTPPTTVMIGTEYSFRPTATDPDGDTLTFSIANMPAWASFNTNTGRLRGTPGQGDVGIHGDIQISVSDGEFTDSLSAFAIMVEDVPNDPPQISGDPPTSATVGQAYSFQPSATDSNGDALTFVISGSPSWASFDTSTGRLDGTPQSGDAGVYSDILISVSDGEATDALPAFSITVTEAATGSVTLRWTPPTRNTDDSTLDDLIAYKFYYGLSPGSYPNEIRVDSPGISSYVIDNLAPDTYYFVSTAIKEGEVESVYSNEAAVTLVSN